MRMSYRVGTGIFAEFLLAKIKEGLTRDIKLEGPRPADYHYVA